MNKPSNPRQLPEFRNSIVDNIDLWAGIMAFEPVTGKKDFENAPAIREFLAQSTLWYVGADACEIIQHAYSSMPPATLTDEIVPDDCGFVWWEKPIFGVAADTGDPIRIEAMQWLTGTLLRETGDPILSIIGWNSVDCFPEMFYYPLGRSDWIYKTDTDHRLPGHGEEAHLSVMEDRRLLACLWQLSSQAKLMSATEEQPDRATRRRLERAKKPVPSVRLINLTAANRRGARSEDGRPVEWSHRWLVRPYWKQQHYGPGRSLRRPVYIAEHVKGPEDKPLVVKDTVKVFNAPKEK